MSVPSRFALFGKRTTEGGQVQNQSAVSKASTGSSELRVVSPPPALTATRTIDGSSLPPAEPAMDLDSLLAACHAEHMSSLPPVPKRRRVAVLSDSEGEDGSEPSSADSTMDILLASQDRGPQHVEKLQAAYKKHRRLYQKHTRLASKAAEAMHLATRMLVRVLNVQPSRTTISPLPVKGRSTPAPACGASEHDYASDCSNDPLSKVCVMRGALPAAGRRASTTRVTASPTVSCTDIVGGEGELRSSSCAARAYPFSTVRKKAFQLKPRAAFACSIGGEVEPKIVAYGLDGTVQIWNPYTQTGEAALLRDDLGFDHVEDMAQLNPHILAGVPKVVAGEACTPSLPSIVFVGLDPPLPGSQSRVSMKVQYWMQSPHEGQISAILGVPRLRQGHSSRAFLLTGGIKDKDVYLWSVQTDGARVTRTLETRKMRANHTARISALCHDHISNNVIAGAMNGRISVNDIESGRLVAASGQPSHPAIGSATLCPTNPNVLMVNYASKGEQVRIFDLRQGITWARPAIALGIDTPRTQSRYSRPAWHPAGGLVVYPYRDGTTAAPNDGLVAIWDTRYTRCNEETPQIYNPHKESIWRPAASA
ncbi:hypothetical protein GGI20_004136 [Coemansia sp. BCRC 34301]|nr:hypothetical protein GGI20_004136 [Coemansia sp. BCRC 34301]